MNTKDFLNILDNLHELATISYEQLDKLLLQFPYCHNLRLLLLKKYQNDDHLAFDRQLSLASTYCPDRQFLSQFVQSNPAANKVIPIQKEEVKETEEVSNEEEVNVNARQDLDPMVEDAPKEKDVIADTEENTLPIKENIEDTEDIIEPLVKEEIPKPKEEIPTVINKVSQTPPRLDLMEIVALKREQDNLDIEERDMSFMPLEEWVQSFTPPRINDKSENNTKRKRFKLSRIPVFEDDRMLKLFGGSQIIKEEDEEEEEIKLQEEDDIWEIPHTKDKALKKEESTPKPFDFFADSTEAFLKSLSDKKQKKSKATTSHLDSSVKESVTENEEVISETLADLLALQGKKDKAIKMYKALSLKFPEKNLFFAEKIEELSREV